MDLAVNYLNCILVGWGLSYYRYHSILIIFLSGLVSHSVSGDLQFRYKNIAKVLDHELLLILLIRWCYTLELVFGFILHLVLYMRFQEKNCELWTFALTFLITDFSFLRVLVVSSSRVDLERERKPLFYISLIYRN